MRSLSSTLTQSAILSSLFWGLSDAQDEPCLGVCPGGTLISPNNIVTLPGSNPDFCFVIDNQLKGIVGNKTQCDTLSTDAREAGCECDGIPTASPTMNPTITRSPTPRPSYWPTGTPTISPAPTGTASPTKVPTTPNPTGTPTTPNPTAAPGFCSGICLEPGQTIADPNFIIVTQNAIGGGVITESCAQADARYKQIYAPGGSCERFSKTAQNSGCSCVEEVDCNGICNSPQVTPKSGQQITTPDLVVEIDGRPDTCANWDAQWDSFTSPLLCDNVPSKISQALAAGCKCDVPIDCPALCSADGEQVTTPNLEVSLSNGVVATCFQLDIEFDASIDPGQCNEFDAYRQEAFDLGCRCGTPIVCDGLCPNENEVLLTPDMEMEIVFPDGPATVTCESLDLQVRTIIDPGLCTDGIDEALAAGCRCGEPIDCKGVCPDGEALLTPDMEVNLPGDGDTMTTATCKSLQEKAKTLIDPIMCDAGVDEALAAGCRCGEPIKCGGICPNKERKLFDKDVKVKVPWNDGKEKKCGDVDKQVKELIDEIMCLERANEAIQAGCQCGPTSSSPSMMPSSSAAPTDTPSSTPTTAPTKTPPTVAPNVPFQPTVGGGGSGGGAPSPGGGGGGPSGGGGGGPAAEAGSGSFKNKQVFLTTMMSMMIAAVYVTLAL